MSISGQVGFRASSGPFVSPSRDARTDPTPAKPATKLLTVVALIRHHGPETCPRTPTPTRHTNGVQEGFRQMHFSLLGTVYQGPQGDSEPSVTIITFVPLPLRVRPTAWPPFWLGRRCHPQGRSARLLWAPSRRQVAKTSTVRQGRRRAEPRPSVRNGGPSHGANATDGAPYGQSSTGVRGTGRDGTGNG